MSDRVSSSSHLDQDNIAERILSLQSEIKSYGADIIYHISMLYAYNTHTSIPDSTPPNVQLIDLKNDPRNILKMLRTDVQDILADAKQYSEYTAKHKQDIQECSSLTQVLESVASASLSIETCEDAILSHDLSLACDALANMQASIKSLPTAQSEIGVGPVCKILRHTAAVLAGRFQSRLRRLLEHAVQVRRGRVQVYKTLKASGTRESLLLVADDSEGIRLQDLWKAVLTTAEGESMVQQVTRQVWAEVLSPLWREKKQVAPSISISPPLAQQDTKGGSRSSSSLNSSLLNSTNSSLAPTAVASTGVSELRFEFSASGPTVGSSTEDSQSSSVSVASQLACRMKFPQLLESVGQVMGFLYTEVFLANDQVVAASVKSLNEHPIVFFQTLAATLLAILPKTESDMELLRQSVAGPCAEFEQKMSLYGFLCRDDVTGGEGGETVGPLTAATNSLYSQFLSARRSEVLAKARSLVLGDYHNTMLGAGDALEDDTSSAGNIGDRQALLEHSGSSIFSPFQSLQFESCQISLACCRLLKLIHEVLKQATGGASSAELAIMLYHTSRDCLEIFEGVVQSKYGDNIQSVARMGAVFFNDCAYIAHNTTLLTHMYRQDLGKIAPDLMDAIGYIDFIPRFRSLGERCLADHVEEQKRILRDLVVRINIRVGEDDENVGGEEGEGVNDADAAMLVVKHLQRLQGQWQNILQDSVYERLMGYLLEFVLRAVMKPVFEAKYISEVAASDLTKSFKVLQKSNTLFEEALPLSSSTNISLNSSTHSHNSNKNTNNDISSSPVSHHVSGGGAGTAAGSSPAGGLVSWNKFCALTDLFEYSLAEISEWLPRRKFAMFTGQEMSSLIRALFEDSPRRQIILTSILEMAS